MQSVLVFGARSAATAQTALRFTPHHVLFKSFVCVYCYVSVLCKLHSAIVAVRVGPTTSTAITTNTGAPQGCVLSPFLYTLYTNDCMTRPPLLCSQTITLLWTTKTPLHTSLSGVKVTISISTSQKQKN